MLDSGKWKNQQFLSPATVRMMTSNRMDDMPEMPESIRRTQPWGLGWKLNHLGQSDSWSDLLDRNVFGHTGSSGNVVWMNPKTRGFCLIFSNYLRSRAPWRLVSISNIVASAFI
jgi:serine-type D-Ala-D-Ala carboxypeptidase